MANISILIDYLDDLSVADSGVLRSLAMIVFLSVSPLSSDGSRGMYFGAT